MYKLDPQPENETASERLKRFMKASGIPVKTKEELRQVLKEIATREIITREVYPMKRISNENN